jgi:hypothetical protein
VLSFGYFSLHKQRKVTRASGSFAPAPAPAPALALALALNLQTKAKAKAKAKAFALRRVTFLCSRKEK